MSQFQLQENIREERVYHALCPDLEVPLEIPKPKGAHRRRNRLSKPQIGIFQEAELEFVILADRNQRASSIQAL